MARVEINPAVCSGKSVVRGTRIMVRNILGMVSGGDTVERVLESRPKLTRGDFDSAVEYASRMIDGGWAVLR